MGCTQMCRIFKLLGMLSFYTLLRPLFELINCLFWKPNNSYMLTKTELTLGQNENTYDLTGHKTKKTRDLKEKNLWQTNDELPKYKLHKVI